MWALGSRAKIRENKTFCNNGPLKQSHTLIRQPNRRFHIKNIGKILHKASPQRVFVLFIRFVCFEKRSVDSTQYTVPLLLFQLLYFILVQV